MKVLFVSWELDPFFKFGGLGDVSRLLPHALKNLGVDIANVLPFYNILKINRIKRKRVGKFTVNYAGIMETVEVYKFIHPSTRVDVYVLKNEKYLSDAIKKDAFPFFNCAIVEMCKGAHMGWVPDIIHCNDHHAGFIPLLVKEAKLPIKTILTIHNMYYQGKYPETILHDMGVDKSKCRILKWEAAGGQINFMMECIIHADIVNTVSPTYAKEIMKPEFGEGLDEVLRGKEGRVFGILNGIDLDRQNVMNTRHVLYPYITFNMEKIGINKNIKYYSWEDGKRLNKRYMQKKLKLKVDERIPLLAFIGRLVDPQKGMGILYRCLKNIDINKIELVLLGTGSEVWEQQFQWMCTFYPKNVSCNFRFDSKLAAKIYAASDFIIIPSKFEPCGLIQMFGMFYGTMPIAHKTGGLADSITDEKNGFLFENYSAESLEHTMDKAVGLYHHERAKYKMMVENAMSTDFSWDKSVREYIVLYEKLMRGEY